jgi:hypothetical protein
MNVRQVLQPAMKSLPQQLWNIRYVSYLATKMKIRVFLVLRVTKLRNINFSAKFFYIGIFIHFKVLSCWYQSFCYIVPWVQQARKWNKQKIYFNVRSHNLVWGCPKYQQIYETKVVISWYTIS